MQTEQERTGSYSVPEPPPRLITGHGVIIAVYALVAVAVGILVLFAKPAFIAGALTALLVGVLIALYPYIGLICYYIDIVVRPEELFTSLAPLHPARAIASGLLLSTLIHKKYSGESFNFGRDRMSRHFLFFIAAMFATVPLAFWKSDSLQFIMDFLWVYVYYLLLINILTTEFRLKGFVWLMMLATGYNAISSAIGYFSGTLVIAQGIERAAGLTGTDPNTLAVNLLLGIPFLYFSLFWVRNILLRLVPLAFLTAAIFTIAITGSRSGVIGLVAAALFVWLLSKRKAISGVIALLVLIASWFALPPQYQERYSTIFAEEKDSSTQGRLDAWKAGWGMFKANPLTGIGVDGFPYAYGSGEYSETRSYLRPHNMYIQLIAEMGILGIITFGSLVWYMIASNVRLRRQLAKAGKPEHFLVWVSHSITTATYILFVTAMFGHSLFRGHWYSSAALTLVLMTLTAKVLSDQVSQDAPSAASPR